MHIYDAVIAGGGPAGSAAAIALARAGLRVLLADRGGETEIRVGEGLPPQARSLLATFGLLDRTLADGHRRSYGTASAWGSAELQFKDFVFQLHDYGLQLDRARFDRMMRQAAAEAGVEICADSDLRLTAPPEQCRKESYQLTLTTKDRVDPVRGRWLIDATGRSASISRSFGATRVSTDALVAIHLRLAPAANDSDEDGSTLVEADEDGWWYTVLVPSGERLVVFLSDADLVDHHTLRTTDGFLNRVRRTCHISQRTARHLCGGTGAPRGANARSSRLDRASGERWLAVGDAALTFDPLSSKGIANALHTGLCGAQTVLATERGDPEACPRFQRHIENIFASYQVHLHQYYGLERRWSDLPFWRRRNAQGPIPAV